MSDDWTTIHLTRDVKDELDSAKPFPSMSYMDLLKDMLDQYNPPR